MQRILVVKDVGLWITLNRHFAGGRNVRLSEAPTLEVGLDLARIERPELVVCCVPGSARSPESLASLLAERGLAAQRVLCVCEGAEETRELRQGFRVCRHEDFLDQVDEIVDRATPESGGDRIDVLAHFEMPGAAGAEPRRGFANLLEISRRELLLESDDVMEVGDALSLTFFIPAPGGADGPRVKIGLRCNIRRCHEVGKLLYVAELSEVEEASVEHFERYLGDLARQRRGEA